MIFKCNNAIISLLVQYYSTKTNNIIILDPRWNQDGSEMINPRSPHSPHHWDCILKLVGALGHFIGSWMVSGTPLCILEILGTRYWVLGGSLGHSYGFRMTFRLSSGPPKSSLSAPGVLQIPPGPSRELALPGLQIQKDLCLGTCRHKIGFISGRVLLDALCPPSVGFCSRFPVVLHVGERELSNVNTQQNVRELHDYISNILCNYHCSIF